MNTREKNEIRSIIREELEKAKNDKEKEKQPQKTLSRIYTRKEVLDLFDISETTLFLWKRDGKIKAHRIGRRVFFKHEDILEALDNTTGNKQN